MAISMTVRDLDGICKKSIRREGGLSVSRRGFRRREIRVLAVGLHEGRRDGFTMSSYLSVVAARIGSCTLS